MCFTTVSAFKIRILEVLDILSLLLSLLLLKELLVGVNVMIAYASVALCILFC